MSKLLANQIANYNDNGPVEAKEGLNIPTSKPLQVAGSPGCLLYTSPSPRDGLLSRMPSSA